VEGQPYFNLDFEIFEKNSPLIWEVRTNPRYDLLQEARTIYRGSFSFSVSRKNTTENFSLIDDGISVAQILPTEILKGKKTLKIVAYIKELNNINGQANIFCRQLDKNEANIQLQYSNNETNNLSQGWKEKIIEVDLKNNALQTQFGFVFIGSGQAWFDSFEIYIDGKKIIQPSYINILPTQNEIKWLDSNIYKIDIQDFNRSISALSNLENIIKDAKIVAVGEPTHGTKEAVITKLQIFKYLVERKGFNTFVLESEMSDSELLNNFIRGSDNYSKKSLINMSLPAIWRNKEMFEIFEWMREYNKTNDNKLIFWGVDMQFASTSLKNIFSFGSKYDKTITQILLNVSTEIEDIRKVREESEKQKKINILKKNCQYLRQYFSENESTYSKTYNMDSLKWVKQNIELLNQSLPMFLVQSGKSIYRDSCMASNVKWVFNNYPKTKMVLSAHNFHVTKDKEFMGNILLKFFKAKYFSIGITTSEGTYSAVDGNNILNLKSWPLSKPFAGCFEYHLQEAKFSSYFLGIPNSKVSPNNKWLFRTFFMRHIGFAREENQFRYETPAIGYNAVIFFRTTTSTTPIPR
jgi:erythromycin esterase